MSDVMTFSKRTAAGLEEVLRTLLLDAESKVPADRLRIVGALSEGAIIEQGSNSNGEYVRFANGLQICQGGRSYNGLDISQQYNSVPVTLPAAFVDMQYFFYGVATGYPGNPGTFITGNHVSVGTTNINFMCFFAPPLVTGLYFRFFAIGKWK